MKIIKEYIYQPGTANTANHESPVDDEQAEFFYNNKVAMYNNSPEWETVGDIENGKKWQHKTNKSYCEITIKDA